jgi:endoglucanase
VRPRAAAASAGLLVLPAAVALVVSAPPSSAAAPSASPAPVLIRVAQAGATTGEPLHAYVMAPKPLPGERFQLIDAGGRVVRSGRLGASAGAWNATYRSVQPIDLGTVGTPGRYHVRIRGGVDAISPVLPVARPSVVAEALTGDTTSFLTLQRDGADVVPGRLDRRPSHLLDRRATVYQPPRFTDPDTDELAAPLKPVVGHGPVDVAGGWFDAGDYLKFTQTASYTLDMTLVALRDSGSGGAALQAETAHGLAWLDKMWDQRTGTLYAQVGIGSGSERLDILGDHDVWRLPEADDAANPAPGSPTYFISHRPVFAANRPGERISPNLAGRTAAAFALAAQVEASRNPHAARRDLTTAAELLARVKTQHPGQLVSVFPYAFYPETSWTDDLELGTVEAALAGRLLGDPRADDWLRQAGHWATLTMNSSDQDSLNLYDTSALAHADLARAVAGSPSAATQSLRRNVIGAIRGQLAEAARRAAGDPFGSAAVVTDYDAVSHELGLVATAELYRDLTGSTAYDDFAARQRGWVFGANAWGTSFVIGEGRTFPLCPQHQVANLAGSLTGGPNVAVGAIVNGPNGSDQFEDLGVPDGANACPVDGVDRFAPFDTRTSTFLDDVAAWPSDEPADDFTATGILAFALGG